LRRRRTDVCQVWTRKASESEPTDDVSKAYRRERNRGGVVALGGAWKSPAYWPGALRHKGGASRVQALVRNV
jgi:hypothetical protein